jgi:hypothetical protein
MFFTTHALSIMDMPDLATPTNDTLAGTARTYVPILTEEDCLRKSFRNKEHVAPDTLGHPLQVTHKPRMGTFGQK